MFCPSPSPRVCNMISEAYHPLLATVYTDYDVWRDLLDAFCEGFQRAFAIKPRFEPFADINLIFDPALADTAFALDTTAAVILRASTREGAVRGLDTLLKLLRLENGTPCVQALLLEY